MKLRLARQVSCLPRDFLRILRKLRWKSSEPRFLSDLGVGSRLHEQHLPKREAFAADAVSV